MKVYVVEWAIDHEMEMHGVYFTLERAKRECSGPWRQQSEDWWLCAGVSRREPTLGCSSSITECEVEA